MRIATITTLTFLLGGLAAAQSGGNFVITQSVIAGGGGGPLTGGTFAVTGTIGQPVAGSNASGGTFSVQAGFWDNNQLAPTAATVGIAGRVLDAFGNPLRNVVITLNDSTGGVLVTRSNAFGYFTFEEVPSGQTYIVELSALDHQFVPQAITVKDSITGLEFRALP